MSEDHVWLKERRKEERALTEYDSVTNPNDPTLHILDPFFAFRLRWEPPMGKTPPEAPE